MDKNETRYESNSEKVTQKPLGTVHLPIASEYNDALTKLVETIEKSRLTGLMATRKSTKSIFADKKTFAMIAKLINTSHAMADLGVKTAYAADYLYRKMEILEAILLKVADHVKDLPAKEELEQLRHVKEQIAHIDAVIGAIEGKQNQSEVKTKDKAKEGEEYIR